MVAIFLFVCVWVGGRALHALADRYVGHVPFVICSYLEAEMSATERGPTTRGLSAGRPQGALVHESTCLQSKWQFPFSPLKVKLLAAGPVKGICVIMVVEGEAKKALL